MERCTVRTMSAMDARVSPRLGLAALYYPRGPSNRLQRGPAESDGGWHGRKSVSLWGRSAARLRSIQRRGDIQATATIINVGYAPEEETLDLRGAA